MCRPKALYTLMNAVLKNIYTENTLIRRVGKRLLKKSVGKSSNEPILLPEFVRASGLRLWIMDAIPTAFCLNIGLNTVCLKISNRGALSFLTMRPFTKNQCFQILRQEKIVQFYFCRHTPQT